MILPVTITGLLAYNWRAFSIVWFFSQYRLQAIHYKSIRDLIVITVFFHVASWFSHRPNSCIAQQIQKIKVSIVTWRKVLPT